jgi:hypothetical protein
VILGKSLLVLLVPTVLAAQAPGTGVIAGRVTGRPDSIAASEISIPIAGATVGIVGSALGVTTDPDGRYTLGNVLAGRTTMRFHRLGYRTLDRSIAVMPNDTVRVDVALEVEAQQLSPVRTDVSRTEVESFTARPNVGTVAMPAQMMAGVPAIGEPDVARVVQLLAGVSARNDYNTGLNVRGGSADQNLVLLDGIPIYNPFHMGGLFSTFMDASVGGIELMTGAFPARYDGRLSSVLDVRSADETRPGLHGTTDASVLATTGQLAGALGNGRGSWSVAARRTYADAIASAFSHDNFPYHFLDLQAHASYLLPNNWRLAVTGYAGRDLRELRQRHDCLERGRRRVPVRLGQSRCRRDSDQGVHSQRDLRAACVNIGLFDRSQHRRQRAGSAERRARRPREWVVRCTKRCERVVTGLRARVDARSLRILVDANGHDRIRYRPGSDVVFRLARRHMARVVAVDNRGRIAR